MSINWQNWCRLCAKNEENGINIFIKLEYGFKLSEVIDKYFNISIPESKEEPNTTCQKCSQFLIYLKQFADQCLNTDSMFMELLAEPSKQLRESELQKLRLKFNLDNNKENIENVFTLTPTEIVNRKCSEIIEKSLRPKTRQLKREIKKRKSVSESSESEYDIFNDDQADSADPFEEDQSNKIQLDEHNDNETDEPRSKSRSPSPRPLTTKKKYNRKQLTFTCETCQKTFTRRHTLVTHIKIKHENIKLPFPCSKCPRTFTTEKRAQFHERVHLPDEMKMIHPCQFCDKKFSTPANVDLHIKAIHQGEKPFVCDKCGKSFVTKGALKAHQTTHSDERPYKCKFCPKTFKNTKVQKTHEDTHDETSYVCVHCGLHLNTKRTLQMHMVVHSDVKKFKCQFCGNEYKRSQALKQHLTLHTGMRPFACPYCNKSFGNESNCRTHKKKEHAAQIAAAQSQWSEHPLSSC